MLELMKKFIKDEEGQDLVEYALLLVFIATPMAKAQVATSEPHKEAPHVIAVQHQDAEEQEFWLGWKEYLCVAIGAAIGYFLTVLTLYYLTSSLPLPFFAPGPDRDRQERTRIQTLALSRKTKTSELLDPRELGESPPGQACAARSCRDLQGSVLNLC